MVGPIKEYRRDCSKKYTFSDSSNLYETASVKANFDFLDISVKSDTFLD